jgi:hypothetical protein
LLFLAAYAYPILNPDLSKGALALCQWTERATWVLFAIDYVMRVALSEDRKGFIRGHIADLVVVVIPILRPLRLLRLITMLHTSYEHTKVPLMCAIRYERFRSGSGDLGGVLCVREGGYNRPCTIAET